MDLVASLFALLHILVFVYWLGGDLGAYYASRFVTRNDLSTPERALAAQVLNGVDMAPRYALIWTFPTGLGLATASGALAAPWIWTGLAAAIAVAWSAIAAHLHRHANTAPSVIVRADQVLRIVLVAGLTAAGLQSLLGLPAWPSGGPPMFLALKFLLLAAAIACGLAIRRSLVTFKVAFSSLLQDGPSPSSNAIIDRTLTESRRFVLVIWACLIAAAALGVFKPM